MNLFDELKRRKVLQTAAIYVAIAWGATEIVVTVEEKFALPEWVSQIAIIAFIVGFPITLFASWFVDISATGFRTTTPGKPLGAKSVGVLAAVSVAATFLLWVLINPAVTIVEECPATDPFCSATASLAVLPFANLTGSDSNDFAATGLSNDLISVLARVKKLRIAAGRSSSIAAGQNLSVADIGETLGVDNILEGRLQTGADGLVIVAQLIDARSQFIFWTRQYAVDSGLLDTREAISAAVAEALKLDQHNGDSDALGAVPTSSAEAYEAYLRGLQVWRVKGYGSAEPLQHFTMAVNLDTEFADAHAAMANTLIEMANSAAIDEDEAFTKAWAATERALEINPQLPQAYVMLGQLRRRGTETGDALNALLRALELNPNDETAHLEVASLLQNQGLLEAANREFEIAYTLDPLNQLLDVYRSGVLQRRGEFAAAMKVLKAQLAADPDSTLVYGNLQILTLMSGAPDATVQFTRDAEVSNAISGWNRAFEAIADSRLGHADAAWSAIHQAEETEPLDYFLRFAKMMRLASDGDAAGLREYAGSFIENYGGKRHWRKWSGLGALMQGDYLGAVELLEAAFELREWYSGIFPAEEIVHMLNLVPAYRALGEDGKAGEWLALCAGKIQRLREQDVSLPDLDYAEGAMHVLQGDIDDGLELLERAAMRGWLGWPIMRHDPKLQALSESPRFATIVAGSQLQPR